MVTVGGSCDEAIPLPGFFIQACPCGPVCVPIWGFSAWKSTEKGLTCAAKRCRILSSRVVSRHSRQLILHGISCLVLLTDEVLHEHMASRQGHFLWNLEIGFVLQEKRGRLLGMSNFQFKTPDHPMAGERVPVDGDIGFQLWFPTDDGGRVLVSMGRVGFVHQAACLLAMMRDDPVLQAEVQAEAATILAGEMEVFPP